MMFSMVCFRIKYVTKLKDLNRSKRVIIKVSNGMSILINNLIETFFKGIRFIIEEEGRGGMYGERRFEKNCFKLVQVRRDRDHDKISP
jgi:hypothetical protein